MLSLRPPVIPHIDSVLALCTPARSDTTAAITVRNEDDVQEEGGGLSWLTSAATRGQSPGRTTCPTPATLHDDVDDDDDDDVLDAALSGRPVPTSTRDLVARSPSPGTGKVLPGTGLISSTMPTTSGRPGESDWLSSAATLGNSSNRAVNAKAMTDASTGQGSRKQNPTSKAPPGAWLTAGGKLGVSTREDSDEDSDTRGSVKRSTATASTERSAGPGSKKCVRGYRPAASGAGGWLTAAVASGTLGMSGGDNDDSSDNDVEGGGLRNRGRVAETATIGTQWEDGVGESASSKSQLPPWAIPYRPRSEEAVAVAAVEDVVVVDTVKEQVKRRALPCDVV